MRIPLAALVVTSSHYPAASSLRPVAALIWRVEAGVYTDNITHTQHISTQHYTYTAHIYTNFKFGIPCTVSKMENRRDCQLKPTACLV